MELEHKPVDINKNYTEHHIKCEVCKEPIISIHLEAGRGTSCFIIHQGKVTAHILCEGCFNGTMASNL